MSTDTPREWAKQESDRKIDSRSFKVWEAAIVVSLTCLGVILNEFHSDRSIGFKVAVAVLLVIAAVGLPYLAVKTFNRVRAPYALLEGRDAEVHDLQLRLAQTNGRLDALARELVIARDSPGEAARVQWLAERRATLQGALTMLRENLGKVRRFANDAIAIGDAWNGQGLHDVSTHHGFDLGTTFLAQIASFNGLAPLVAIVRSVSDRLGGLQQIGQTYTGHTVTKESAMRGLPASRYFQNLLDDLDAAEALIDSAFADATEFGQGSHQ